MSDEQKGFTVKDRRLFTPEGELRGARDEEAAAPTPAAAPQQPVTQPPARSPQSQPRAPGAERESEPLGGAISFGSFLVSLGAQAGALLDDGQDGALEGARQIISILEMLQDKTQGRRTPEEDQVLEGLLYELRMAYVERARMTRA